jgi:uncharacterized integral membrane protein (TIGR00698 family)
MSRHAKLLLPGLVLSAFVALVATALEASETHVFGRAAVEALVIAILVGAVLRTTLRLPARLEPGIAFGARLPLELAILLLGASMDLHALAVAGPGLVAGVAIVVLMAIPASYGIGRLLGLGHRMALLVAMGNSICGNSAIAAAAPVIGADGDDVAASIAFTGVLGIATILMLPTLAPLLGLSATQYGVVAGLTVYAVPQVLAAAAPLGLASVQTGMLVKLLRVLMLGPALLAIGFSARRERGRGEVRLVPWFLLGFAALAALRSLGLVPDVLLAPIHALATVLTLVAMAALGLGTDLRQVGRSGGRVLMAALLSLAMLGLLSLSLLKLIAFS